MGNCIYRVYEGDNLSTLNGKKPIRSKPWPTYDKGDVLIDDDDVREVLNSLKSKRLFRYDSCSLDETPVGKFEASIKNFFKTNYALAVSSGTAALALGLMSLGIEHNDSIYLAV